MLVGFKTVSLVSGIPYVSITGNGVTFNKPSIVKLGRPSHVLLLINEQDRQIAVQPCDTDNPEATPFLRNEDKAVLSVRWNNRDFSKTISKMMGWNLGEGGYRVDGDYLSEDDAMVFDLKTAKPINNDG